MIKIDITGLEDGWEIIGSHFMVGKMLIHIIEIHPSLRVLQWALQCCGNTE